jgi:hypothetical protein
MTDGNLPGSEQYLITYLPDTGGMIAHRIKWEQTENKADKGHWQTYGRVFVDELPFILLQKQEPTDDMPDKNVERLEIMELNIHAIVERLDDIEATIQAIKERPSCEQLLKEVLGGDGEPIRLDQEVWDVNGDTIHHGVVLGMWKAGPNLIYIRTNPDTLTGLRSDLFYSTEQAAKAALVNLSAGKRRAEAIRSCDTCRWCEIEDGRACGCRHNNATAKTCHNPTFELWEAK